MTFELKGATVLATKLNQLAATFPLRAAAALYQEGLIEEKEMKRRCPVAPDGGTLRASIVLHKPVISGREISCRFEAGGPAQEYAIAVHEHPSEHSPASWEGLSAEEIQWNVAGTGPGFISGPLLESAPFMGARIGKRLNLERL